MNKDKVGNLAQLDLVWRLVLGRTTSWTDWRQVAQDQCVQWSDRDRWNGREGSFMSECERWFFLHTALHDAQIFAFVDALSCVTENRTIFVQSWKRSNIWHRWFCQQWILSKTAHCFFCFNLFSWSICANSVILCCRIPIKLGIKCTVWLSSRAKYGGPLLPDLTGSTEDPSTVSGSYDHLGYWNLMTFKRTSNS